MNRDWAQVQIDSLGVNLVPHKDSVIMWVADMWHDLQGNPWFDKTVWMTLHPYIYYPSHIKDPMEYWEIIAHELVHWERQRDMGVMEWVWNYITDWSFREREEKPAFVRSIKLRRLSPRQAAQRLRGPLYGVETPEDELTEWFKREIAIQIPRRIQR